MDNKRWLIAGITFILIGFNSCKEQENETVWMQIPSNKLFTQNVIRIVGDTLIYTNFHETFVEGYEPFAEHIDSFNISIQDTFLKLFTTDDTLLFKKVSFKPSQTKVELMGNFFTLEIDTGEFEEYSFLSDSTVIYSYLFGSFKTTKHFNWKLSECHGYQVLHFNNPLFNSAIINPTQNPNIYKSYVIDSINLSHFLKQEDYTETSYVTEILGTWSSDSTTFANNGLVPPPPPPYMIFDHIEPPKWTFSETELQTPEGSYPYILDPFQNVLVAYYKSGPGLYEIKNLDESFLLLEKTFGMERKRFIHFSKVSE